MLGGVGAVFESDSVSVAYRGSIIARRDGTDPANPSELMLVTTLELTNQAEHAREVRSGLPHGMDIRAHAGSFGSQERWMGECAADGVP